ncbi:hypothetical protein FIBSPDRAFT_798128 [Athelia psychrophila]|uniref:Uncharacterized protein n=1 Tax=Athelia psychrophila TaxID=1759441 RepID=A0A166C043_9AGAM|nr:hypothetical protein FIBSPDRAFT_798128 [Fibularhizoctonia sp. CBS 109695]
MLLIEYGALDEGSERRAKRRREDEEDEEHYDGVGRHGNKRRRTYGSSEGEWTSAQDDAEDTSDED